MCSAEDFLRTIIPLFCWCWVSIYWFGRIPSIAISPCLDIGPGYNTTWVSCRLPCVGRQRMTCWWGVLCNGCGIAGWWSRYRRNYIHCTWVYILHCIVSRLISLWCSRLVCRKWVCCHDCYCCGYHYYCFCVSGIAEGWTISVTGELADQTSGWWTSTCCWFSQKWMANSVGRFYLWRVHFCYYYYINSTVG